jgi:hypothetical protein
MQYENSCSAYRVGMTTIITASSKNVLRISIESSKIPADGERVFTSTVILLSLISRLCRGCAAAVEMLTYITGLHSLSGNLTTVTT